MTKAFKDMLYLLGAGARGLDISAEGMNMEEIRECAIAQGVWPIVYKAAEKTANISAWRSEFIFTMARTVSRRDFTLATIKKLEEAGVEYCLMKGPVVAKLYANPDCRISGDVDIYINPDDENKVIEILSETGYNVRPRAKNDHHLKATHPVGGLLESHIRMYGKVTEELVFGGHITYSLDFDKMIIDGVQYSVMNEYDELLYLTAHYIKHLVNGGCGVRQMLDLLLYMEKHADTLDFDKYNELMKKLRYDKLLDVIKTIGTKYFGYDYPVRYEELADELLTDAENGGTFGYLASDRDNFYEAYCARRTKRSRLKHIIYINFNKENTIINKIFPDRKNLVKNGYGYARCIILVPFAWAHRLFDVALRKKRMSSENKSAALRTSKRIGMMKELDMID